MVILVTIAWVGQCCIQLLY